MGTEGRVRVAKERIIPALPALAGLPGVSLEDAHLVAKAMDRAEAGLDFADALHLAAFTGCEGFVTFDRRFARNGTHLAAIPVSTL